MGMYERLSLSLTACSPVAFTQIRADAVLSDGSAVRQSLVTTDSLGDARGSPALEPFVTDLPVPPEPLEVPPFIPDALACPLPENLENARFFEIVEEETHVQLHPDLPPTAVWHYRDVNAPEIPAFAVGPTFKVRMGLGRKTVFVRMLNRLPPDHEGPAIPCTTVHLHVAHIEARSDGFPENIDPFPPFVFAPPGFGEVEPPPGIDPPSGCEEDAPDHYDYCYEMRDPGFSTGEGDPDDRPSTLWYHDYLFDFTGPNVDQGLAGFFLVFDEIDSGDENDPSPLALRLPSGEFDIPLAFQDRLIAPDGALIYDPFDHNGFLGDQFLVNGAVRPKVHVQRRKYRFRMLNGSNARFYSFFLTDRDGRTFTFDQIATDGGLMAHPIRGLDRILIASAQRKEIIIDFAELPDDVSEVYLVNRLRQEDGRGPHGTFEKPRLLEKGMKILKFIVDRGGADDPSRVPDVLRPFDPIPQKELDRARVRTFVFDRRNGVWTINGRLADLEHPSASPIVNTPEIWRLVNKSGGWWHPIHMHLEFMRVLSRNGKQPFLGERDGMARMDTVILGPNGEVDVFLKFRDYPGPWVFHCHNIEHEDMRMMARFDVVEDGPDAAGGNGPAGNAGRYVDRDIDDEGGDAGKVLPEEAGADVGDGRLSAAAGNTLGIVTFCLIAVLLGPWKGLGPRRPYGNTT